MSGANTDPGESADTGDRSPLGALTRLVNAFGSNYPASVREDMDFAREVIAEARLRNTTQNPGQPGTVPRKRSPAM